MEIEGVKIFSLPVSQDLRGNFIKIYNQHTYKEAGIVMDLREQYYSISHKDVIRGMHFQTPPYACDKLVTVMSGAIIDVVLDIRKNSSTYLKWITVRMEADKPSALYIPAGCAHGFLSLEDHTCMLYNVSNVFNKDCDTGIRWDSFGYEWDIKTPVLSDKDKNLIPLNQFESPF